MFWYVYIAKAKTGRYYTGIATNPNKRILEHNKGKGSQLSRQQGPFAAVYISRSLPNKSEARKREAQVKGWTRKKKENLINGEWQ